MAVPSGFCQAESTLTCLSSDTTLQIFIGVMPITNPFPVTMADTQITLQATINASIIAGNGVTITILDDSVFPLTCPLGGSQGSLHLLIQIESSSQITDVVVFTDSQEGFQSISSTPFVCNLSPSIPKRRKKKRRGPLVLCINKFNNGGVIMECPEHIPTSNGVYKKVFTSNSQCCYIKI